MRPIVAAAQRPWNRRPPAIHGGDRRLVCNKADRRCQTAFPQTGGALSRPRGSPSESDANPPGARRRATRSSMDTQPGRSRNCAQPHQHGRQRRRVDLHNHGREVARAGWAASATRPSLAASAGPVRVVQGRRGDEGRPRVRRRREAWAAAGPPGAWRGRRRGPGRRASRRRLGAGVSAPLNLPRKIHCARSFRLKTSPQRELTAFAKVVASRGARAQQRVHKERVVRFRKKASASAGGHVS